jgi:hypothetical protein
MSGRKLLIDTNVFIGLEDEREVAPEFATLQALCAQHGVRIFVHERAADDIGRDRTAKRRALSLSKIQKFEQLRRVSEPPKGDLVAKFGPMPKPNDLVDVALLHALDINTVDFLVTQDQAFIPAPGEHRPPSATECLPCRMPSSGSEQLSSR